MASTPYCFFIGVRKFSTSFLHKLSHSSKWVVQIMDCTPPVDMKDNKRSCFISKAVAFGKGQYTMMNSQAFQGLYAFSGVNKLSTRAGKIQDLESPGDIRDDILKDTSNDASVAEDEDNVDITDKDLRYNKGLIEARDIWLQMEKLEDEYEELFTVNSFKKLAEVITDSEENVSEDSDSSSEDTYSRSEKNPKDHIASCKTSDTESDSGSDDTSFGDYDRRFDRFDFD